MVASIIAAVRKEAGITGTRPGRDTLLLYLGIGLAVRLMMLGKPAFQSDEQFYLLVGQRMVQGALPYVDIWDRKPWGLFAIYRAIYALPFDPVLTYQVLGLISSVLTALVIERIARLIAPPGPARMTGIVYLLWQPVFNVALGQSPVFYNLPVALAALIVVQARLRDGDPLLARRGTEAMLMLGLAMQIKYTVVFEGVAFGLMLLARGREDGWSIARLALTGTVWIAAALAPTAAVLTGYALAGHGEAFVLANFVSIAGRSMDLPNAFANLGKECLALIPFALAILVAPQRLSPIPGKHPAALKDLRLWALAGLSGFLAFGTWFEHYVGPLLVPFSVLSVHALGRIRGERTYGRLLLATGLIGAIVVPAAQVREKGTAAEFAATTRTIVGELRGRCLYVFEGDSALYRTTNACIPTRFAYPSHLNGMNEAKALGIDPASEIRRILASKPGVIVMAETRRPNRSNAETRAIVLAELHRNYERFGQAGLGTRRFGLWRLKAAALRR